MDLKALRTNTAKEEEGVWVGKEEIEERFVDVSIDEDTRLLIASSRNKKFRNYIVAKGRRRQRGVRRMRPDDERALELVDDISIEGIARHVLLGWEGIKEDGVAVPYSVEAAERILREIPTFRNLVEQLAEDITLYQDEEAEEVEKN